jgi:hypothetical protein
MVLGEMLTDQVIADMGNDGRRRCFTRRERESGRISGAGLISQQGGSHSAVGKQLSDCCSARVAAPYPQSHRAPGKRPLHFTPGLMQLVGSLLAAPLQTSLLCVLLQQCPCPWADQRTRRQHDPAVRITDHDIVPGGHSERCQSAHRGGTIMVVSDRTERFP